MSEIEWHTIIFYAPALTPWKHLLSILMCICSNKTMQNYYLDVNHVQEPEEVISNHYQTKSGRGILLIYS